MEEYLLEMKNIHKRFPGVYALKGVDLTLKAGEVMALVGENGAGKSTIINILGGIYTRDEGEIQMQAFMESKMQRRRESISFIRNWCLCRIYLWRKIFS